MQKTFRFFKWSGKKAIIALILTVVLVVAAIDVTLAVILTRTQTIRNSFPPANLTISTWTGNDVINAGDVDIYVRANVVATWISDTNEKTVYSSAPVEGVDYTLTISDGWFKASDGFYYRSEKLAAAQSVQLIDSATQKANLDGYTLRIFVMSSAIQARPEKAVNESWSAVRVSADGTLVINDGAVIEETVIAEDQEETTQEN